MENISSENTFSNLGQLYFCEQCGRCSSACPITGINSFNIRQIIRHVEMSKIDELIKDLLPWLCLTCGRCEEACPNGIKILDLIRSMRRYTPKNFVPPVPCITACPVGINIPAFIRLIANGFEDKALDLILQKTPMPGVLGRVCHRPCESKCRRSKIDNPVSICSLKRYAWDKVDDYLGLMYKPGLETKKKVLVIGSGPAGLSVSYYLRRQGHSVLLIEGRKQAGGMLRYGIPSYRLPRSVLDIEIDRIVSMGIDLRTNTLLEDLFQDQVLKKSFDAICIATGLQSSSLIPMNNNILDGVIYGLDFLKNIESKNLSNIGKRVLVIGGGNVAIDVAMAALRLGGTDVKIACLEKRNEMSADLSEVKIATDEGIKILNSWSPKQFLGDTTVSSVELINCESIFNKENEFDPQFGEKIKTLIVDQVIIAIGQTYDKEVLKKLSYYIGDEINIINGFISVDEDNKLRGDSNIFAVGDIIGSTQSVVSAIASGRTVANSIDCFLGGDGVFLQEDIFHTLEVDDNMKFLTKSSYIERQESKKIHKKERIKCFNEIKCGLTSTQVKLESNRCLCCDLERTLASH